MQQRQRTQRSSHAEVSGVYVDGTVDVIGTVSVVSTAPDTTTAEGGTGGANTAVGLGPSAQDMITRYNNHLRVLHQWLTYAAAPCEEGDVDCTAIMPVKVR